jgi:hypothetical protein
MEELENAEIRIKASKRTKKQKDFLLRFSIRSFCLAIIIRALIHRERTIRIDLNWSEKNMKELRLKKTIGVLINENIAIINKEIVAVIQ